IQVWITGSWRQSQLIEYLNAPRMGVMKPLPLSKGRIIFIVVFKAVTLHFFMFWGGKSGYTESTHGLIHTTEHDRNVVEGRFDIRDSPRSKYFYVYIKNLTKSDSGTYWCGFGETLQHDSYTKIQLTVSEYTQPLCVRRMDTFTQSDGTDGLPLMSSFSASMNLSIFFPLLISDITHFPFNCYCSAAVTLMQSF
uniref:Immunoglobulin V-set domain-containing protein n=1 Tax=Salarias fasciatus TaxID=181472 RepID=A0A672HJA1_SALFA